MPQTKSGEPSTNATTESTGESTQSMPAAAHHISSPYFNMFAIVATAAVVYAVAYRLRTAAVRAWSHYSTEIGGEFEAKSQLSPRFVSGTIGGRAVFMETATNNDDDAPYYHTRVSTPIRNNYFLITGLRRKSMLEEAQSRRDSPQFNLGDAEFDRRFHLVCNEPEILGSLFDHEVRRGLLRYPDVEIYVGLSVLEWRRSGEVSDIQAIRWLNSTLTTLADRIEALPVRPITLSQRLKDEDLIRKGI